MSIKALCEQRAEIGKDIRRLADLANDEQHDWTTEDEQNWAQANKDYDGLGEKIQRLRRAEEVDAHQEEIPEPRQIQSRETPEGRPGPDVTEEDRALALQGWCRSQALGLEERHEKACRKLGIDPFAREFHVPLRRDYSQVRREYRAQATTATAGGEYIPVGFVNQLELALLAYGGVRQVATVMRTDTGNALHWPTTNDTGNTGALLAENTQDGELDVVTAELVLNAYKYTSKIVRVSVELMQDSAFDMAAVLADLLGERLGRIQNTHQTTGTGTAQPKGIVTASTLGKTTAGATAITGDEVIDLVHSVDPAYRSGPGVGFMMHDGVLLYVRKIKDGNSQYLWSPDYTAGVPARLVGYPVTINQDMQATVATATKTMLFGAFRKYIIRDVRGVTLVRMVERYADFHQVAFVAFLRMDADLLNAGTNPVKHLLQA